MDKLICLLETWYLKFKKTAYPKTKKALQSCIIKSEYECMYVCMYVG